MIKGKIFNPLDALQALKDKGVPVPPALMTAAAGGEAGEGKDEKSTESLTEEDVVLPPQAAKAVAADAVLPGAPVIFNPLTALTGTPEFKAEAAMQNLVIGTCAKCNEPMIRGVIGNGDPMFYCPNCRVTSPMSDEAI